MHHGTQLTIFSSSFTTTDGYISSVFGFGLDSKGLVPGTCMGFFFFIITQNTFFAVVIRGVVLSGKHNQNMIQNIYLHQLSLTMCELHVCSPSNGYKESNYIKHT